MFFTRKSAELSKLRMENAELKEQAETLTAANKMLRVRLRKSKYISTYEAIIPIKDIHIKSSFGTPNPDKLAICKEHYLRTGNIDRTIAVYHNAQADTYTLIDGYTGYLVLRDAGAINVRAFAIENKAWGFRPASTNRFGKLQNGSMDDAAKMLARYAAALMNGAAPVSVYKWLEQEADDA